MKPADKVDDRKNDIAYDRSEVQETSALEPTQVAYDGTAASKLRYMIDQAKGAMLTPEVVADLVRENPDNRDQIFAVLQQRYGNSFVQLVIAAAKGPATAGAPTPSTADAAPGT